MGLDGAIPPVSDQEEDNFEVLEVTKSRHSERALLKRLSTVMDLNSPTQQVVIGSAGGWVVGYLFRKFGKVLASAVGGGLMIVQVANQSGYIQVNWKKVNKDTRAMTDNIQRNHPQIQSYVTRAKKLCQENVPISVGFAGGFLVGMAT